MILLIIQLVITPILSTIFTGLRVAGRWRRSAGFIVRAGVQFMEHTIYHDMI